MHAVETGEPPYIPIPIDAPVPPDERVPYDMTEHKKALDWKRFAETWTQTYGAAQSFKDAETAIKSQYRVMRRKHPATASVCV